jgi:hypothetical protein
MNTELELQATGWKGWSDLASAFGQDRRQYEVPTDGMTSSKRYVCARVCHPLSEQCAVWYGVAGGLSGRV